MRLQSSSAKRAVMAWTAPAIFAALVALDPSAVSRQRPTEKLPTAAEVLDRYVQVTGGREALLRHKSMTMRGHLQIPARKLDLEGVQFTAGGKVLQRITLANGKESLSGYDGHTAWDMDASGKVSIAQGEVVKSVARDADMYYHLHVLQYFKSMDVVDVSEFNGRPCYHLKGINNWNEVNEQFYDTENGLLRGYKYNTAWRGGHGDGSDTFEEYKDFGGVRMSTKNTSRDGDDVFIFHLRSVTYDDVDDAVFALPEPAKKALAAKGGNS